MVTINPNHVDLDLHCPIGWSNSQTHILYIKLHLHLPTVQLLSHHVIQLDMICIYIYIYICPVLPKCRANGKISHFPLFFF